jgi:adenosylcobinamide amidohydrolase
MSPAAVSTETNKTKEYTVVQSWLSIESINNLPIPGTLNITSITTEPVIKAGMIPATKTICGNRALGSACIK